MSNADTVRAIYGAFGSGDIPAILEHIAPDAAMEAWDQEHQTGDIPYLRRQTGPEGFGAFFGEVAKYEIKDFQVLDVIGDGRQVVVEVFIHNVVPETGKEIRDEELHLWTFGDDGKVVRMRHYVDTAKHLAAHA
jgi:uncharacterized protein